MTAPSHIIALHDVSPRHASACARILSFLQERQLPPAALLLVPDFHHHWPLDVSTEFVSQVKNWAAAGHELALHGLHHFEERQTGGGLSAAFQRKFMTGGEGEFLALSADEVRERLEAGLAIWKCTGLPRPQGFVPPAWLYNENLDPELSRLGFSWTESHLELRAPGGTVRPSPVISWASRDALRRLGSLIVCPTLARRHRHTPLLRVAIHPHDFDWPSLVQSISRVLEYLGHHGSFGTYQDALREFSPSRT